MAEEQVLNGPYSNWLWSARRQIGERAWDSLVGLPSGYADSLLRAYGVVPFEDSVEHYHQQRALGESAEGVPLKLRMVKNKAPVASDEDLEGRRTFPDPPAAPLSLD